MMAWPKLPAKAAYLALNNPKRRNALSLSVLRGLKDQLVSFNTSPVDGKLRILPPFQPRILEELEAISANAAATTLPVERANGLRWLLDADEWRKHRRELPNVLVLRSEGPVFCSGHDLGELRKLSHEEVMETFALCAEVMSLIRRSPAPVVGVVQGLATAAGAQLTWTTDLPIAAADTNFRLPGASIGLPCTSPSTAMSRHLGAPFTYRMLALAEPVRADQLPGGAVECVADYEALETGVGEIINKLFKETAPQSQAFGKWAFYVQNGLTGGETGGDGYEEAVTWAGRVMALHARSAEAKEGVAAFFEKRRPDWKL